MQYYYLLLFIVHTVDHGGAAVVGKTGWMVCLFEYIIVYTGQVDFQSISWVYKIWLCRKLFELFVYSIYLYK